MAEPQPGGGIGGGVVGPGRPPGSGSKDGTTGPDTMTGGRGADTLRGFEGDDLLRGGTGDDVLFGLDDDDTLKGADGDDALIGGLGDDLMVGGAGADTFYFGSGASPGAPITGEGDDTIRGFSASEGDLISLFQTEKTSVVDTAKGALVSLSAGGTILLAGITAAEVQDSWFISGG